MRARPNGIEARRMQQQNPENGVVHSWAARVQSGVLGDTANGGFYAGQQAMALHSGGLNVFTDQRNPWRGNVGEELCVCLFMFDTNNQIPSATEILPSERIPLKLPPLWKM